MGWAWDDVYCNVCDRRCKLKYVRDVLPWSFGLMCVFWVGGVFTLVVSDNFILSGLWIIVVFHTFVLSIMHVAKYDERKKFVIISLVISAFLVITFLVGVGIGIGIVMQG